MIFGKQIEKMYRNMLFTRNDNADGIFYFGPGDFPGLKADPYAFRSKMGHELKGYFYHYVDSIPGRVLVFDHGMGNGHRAYMREIETLAKAGFLVFSYDHTGCMESGGPGCNGFAQSLCDLDDCMTALKAEPALTGRSFSVIGHSWGGFSTMNITALHPEITHVVSMSGFLSVERILAQTFGGVLKFFRKGILELERRTNPDYVGYNAVETLRKTAAKVLLVYSADDSVVHKAVHFDPLKEALEGRENIRFLLVEGKDHNPTYTVEAVKEKNEFFRMLTQMKKKKLLETRQQQEVFMACYDWWRMTSQDEDVWNVIVEALKTE